MTFKPKTHGEVTKDDDLKRQAIKFKVVENEQTGEDFGANPKVDFELTRDPPLTDPLDKIPDEPPTED